MVLRCLPGCRAGQRMLGGGGVGKGVKRGNNETEKMVRAPIGALRLCHWFKHPLYRPVSEAGY